MVYFCSRRASRDGFSLIQTTTAIAVLVVGILSLLSAMVLGLQHVAGNRQAQHAQRQLQTMLEELRAADWAELLPSYQGRAVDLEPGGLPNGLLEVQFGSESQAAAFVGRPVDLDNDTVFDELEAAHAGMVSLFVTIRVRWQDRGWTRRSEVQSLLVRRSQP